MQIRPPHLQRSRDFVSKQTVSLLQACSIKCWDQCASHAHAVHINTMIYHVTLLEEIERKSKENLNTFTSSGCPYLSVCPFCLFEEIYDTEY